MTENHSVFNGSIPQNYDRYLGPIIFEDYAIELANYTASLGGGRILEVAAGTGILSRQLQDVLTTEMEILVTDLNQDMLHFAQKKTGQENNLKFCCADAMHIPFADNTFDIIVVQFGIMFFSDKVATLREWARVLKPDGHVVLNIWDSIEQNHLIRTVTEALEKFFPKGIPDFFNVPYGWYNFDEIKRVFREAGYHSLEMSVSNRESPCISARQVAFGYLTGTPFSHAIDGQTDFTLDTVCTYVEHMVRTIHGDPPKGAMMQAFIIKAQPLG